MRLSPVDQDALRRALNEARREPSRAGQLARMEKNQGLLAAQMQAAYGCQTRNLKLKPWESPPMFGDVEGGDASARDKARELLDRVLATGLSRYEPDPVGALQAIEARRSPLSSLS
jgi:hypothetical protein